MNSTTDRGTGHSFNWFLSFSFTVQDNQTDMERSFSITTLGFSFSVKVPVMVVVLSCCCVRSTHLLCSVLFISENGYGALPKGPLLTTA
uniref:LUC7 N terminus domain-containing family protein n=1 Tax=Rhizophora mucronata TaxID=61149 RepID=A0A2P2LVC8_RHIMU